MKAKAIHRTSTAAVIVAGATVALLLALTAPALALEPWVIEHDLYPELQMPEKPDVPMVVGTFIPPLDFEFVPSGSEETTESDEPVAPEGGEETVEPDAIDDGGDECGEPDEPAIPDDGRDEGDVPDEPEIPDDGEDEPGLPFTGGNDAPYVLGGLMIALAGVGVLVGRRHVFSK